MRKKPCLVGIGVFVMLHLFGLTLYAQNITFSRNLVGIREVQDRIIVGINIKGAEEFRVDAEEVKRIILNAAKSAGIETSSPVSGMPRIFVSIVGETAGGGGARFTIEIDVTLSIPSPFAKSRSIEVILWHGSRSRDEVMHYDPEAKTFVKPTTPINERVYKTVQELASQLESDFKQAGEWG